MHLENGAPKTSELNILGAEVYKALMEQNQRDYMMPLHLRANQLLAEQSTPHAVPKGKACPHCGGEAIPNYELCKNCASPLAWVEGYPCRPGEERMFAESLQEARTKLEKDAIEDRKIEEKAKQKQLGILLKKTGFISILLSLVSLMLNSSGKKGQDAVVIGCVTFIVLSFFGWLMAGAKSRLGSILKFAAALAALYGMFKVVDAISQVVVGSDENTRRAIEAMNEIQRKYGRP